LQRPPKKLIYVLTGLLLVYAIFRSVFAAIGKPLWYDELLTLTVSSLGNWSAILRALRLPLDGQPPLFYMIEHFASGVTRNQEIALRLPSILALPFTLTCVFVYTKKNCGEIVAFLCALFLLMTSVFQLYAVEARPYSMVVACIAFALVCYQRAPSPVWTVLLALSLALAQSLHYLAVLAMVPFGLAEAVHWWNTRKFRWPVWAALVAGAMPLLLFWNLLAINKAYYGVHFWARFPFSEIPSTYGQIFLANSEYGAAIAALALAGVVGTALWVRQPETAGSEAKDDPLSEATLLFGFVALPFLGYVLSQVLHSGMTSRYVLSTAIGVSIALGYMLSRAKLAAAALFAIFVFSTVGVRELHFWRASGSQIRDAKSSGATAGRLIESAGHKDLPVVAPSGLTLMWLAHYASPPVTDRLLYPTQDPAPNDEKWADTVDKGVKLLPDYLPLRVSSYSAIAAAHKAFLLYVEDEDTPRDWLTLRLSREGWSMETVALDESRRIYLVSRNDH
jgi:hypothetical protein